MIIDTAAPTRRYIQRRHAISHQELYALKAWESVWHGRGGRGRPVFQQDKLWIIHVPSSGIVDPLWDKRHATLDSLKTRTRCQSQPINVRVTSSECIASGLREHITYTTTCNRYNNIYHNGYMRFTCYYLFPSLVENQKLSLLTLSRRIWKYLICWSF